MAAIIESDWKRGWTPCADDHGEFGQQSGGGVLRYDNLTLEEDGITRLAKGTTPISTGAFTQHIKAIYSTNFDISGSNRKLRYVYGADGTLLRNWNSGGSEDAFTKFIFSGGDGHRCVFLNALGHVFAISGSKKYKDSGSTQKTLGIPKPTAPSVAANSPTTLNIGQLDGSDKFTNWACSDGSGFDKTGTVLLVSTDSTTNIAKVYTNWTNAFDTTNLGGAGKDTPDDLLKFDIRLSDPSKLISVRVEIACEITASSATTPDFQNYYWFEWNFQEKVVTEAPIDFTSTDSLDMQTQVMSTTSLRQVHPDDAGYADFFRRGANSWTSLFLKRGQFNRVGADDGYGWNNIKCLSVTIQSVGTLDVILKNFIFQGGADDIMDGEYTYAVMEVRDTGEYLEFSPPSDFTTPVTVRNASIQVNRSGTAVDSQANQLWVFRSSKTTGQFLVTKVQTGADGFTPTSFKDTNSDLTLIRNAQVNQQYVMENFRTALPNTIRGMIWFGDRVIYLTPEGFIPSYQYDPGSYDSRFVYEIASTSGEQCLFITKLDIGNFLIGTTRDFYRVSGTFNKITSGDISTLDVTILPLNINEPPISAAHTEMNGGIVYVSSTGIRSLANTSTGLISEDLELLFRNETRYDIPPISLGTRDTSDISMVTSSNRLYITLPHSDNVNRVYILTYGSPENSFARTPYYWRLWTEATASKNPIFFCREEDGKVLCGSFGALNNYLNSFDTNASATLPVHFRTRMSFGQHPNNRKDMTAIVAAVDTGGTAMTMKVWGYMYDGSIVTTSFAFTSNGAITLLDKFNELGAPIALGIEIYGSTATFRLNHVIFQYNPRPELTRRVRVPASNLGKANLKKIAAWPFLVDSLGGTVYSNVVADGSSLNQSQGSTTGPRTLFWRNTNDVAAVDWGLDLTSITPFELYKVMSPEILQIFPMGKLYDQVGPVDLNAKGLVFGFRLRVIATDATIHYKVYDADTLAYENDLTFATGVDTVTLEKLPRGVNPAVCRIVLTSNGVFYRFSLEFHIRTTGKDTEGQFVKVKDQYAGS